MGSVTFCDPPTREIVLRSVVAPSLESDLLRVLLIMTTGEDAPVVLEFGSRSFLTVGRADPADICISDPGVSRVHARFVREPSGVRVIDLDSRNGVWYRGARVAEALLGAGECVLMGTTTVLIQTAPTPAAALAGTPIGFSAPDGSAALAPPRVSESGINLRASVQQHETRLIREALSLSGGNQRRAAALLELPLRTFERKLRNITLRQQRAAARQS
jgi:hypothetical protein